MRYVPRVRDDHEPPSRTGRQRQQRGLGDNEARRVLDEQADKRRREAIAHSVGGKRFGGAGGFSGFAQALLSGGYVMNDVAVGLTV